MTPEHRRAVLSLGSNQGDRMVILQGAVDALAATPGVAVVAVSGVFETEPVGGPQQPDFLNAVVVADTSLSPAALLERAQAVEQQFGRARAERWGPRTLDVDIVAMGDLVLDEADLVVPHPRAAERAFVLVPWAEADPAAVLPGAGAVADLVAALDVRGVSDVSATTTALRKSGCWGPPTGSVSNTPETATMATSGVAASASTAPCRMAIRSPWLLPRLSTARRRWGVMAGSGRS